jgi:hypothetical protein
MSNTERLKALKDRILEHKDRFYYARWVAPIDDLHCYGTSRLVKDGYNVPTQAHELQHNCDTVGCVGGWAMTFIDVPSVPDPDLCLSDYVESYLCLTNKEFDFLCFGKAEFGFEYTNVNKATVDDAIARLDFLINNPNIEEYPSETTNP